MHKPSLIGQVETPTVTFFDLAREDLTRVEERLREKHSEHHPNLGKALDLLLNSGGKRIRPITAILVGQLLKADPERVITHAAAIEMLHTATLVHDDLIDGASLRRGMPTLNAQWSSGATVLTGDYIFARAAQLAAETGSLPLMDVFARTLMTIVNGEITQLFGEDSGDPLKSYQQRIYAKTASLFEVASEGAAFLGDTTKEQIAAMKQFGYYIGMAFQIVDDVLDFTGNPDDVGKPVGSDLRQGLITLPALMYSKDHPSEMGVVNKVLNGSLPDGQLEQLIRDIRESDSIAQSLEQAGGYIQEGLKYLEQMPAKPEREGLRELANYIVSRST